MGLDNGFYVRSNHRKLTRDMLPQGLEYPFDDDSDLEVIYHRKDWGWRDSIMAKFNWKDPNFYDDTEDVDTSYLIETPAQVMALIELTASWLDEEKWENEGRSIWEYEVARPHLVHDIITLALLYGFMQQNPDVFLEFYDSY